VIERGGRGRTGRGRSSPEAGTSGSPAAAAMASPRGRGVFGRGAGGLARTSV
jgi:hypothetical protein